MMSITSAMKSVEQSRVQSTELKTDSSEKLSATIQKSGEELSSSTENSSFFTRAITVITDTAKSVLDSVVAFVKVVAKAILSPFTPSPRENFASLISDKKSERSQSAIKIQSLARGAAAKEVLKSKKDNREKASQEYTEATRTKGVMDLVMGKRTGYSTSQLESLRKEAGIDSE